MTSSARATDGDGIFGGCMRLEGGWVIGPRDQRLLWVPPEQRVGL